MDRKLSSHSIKEILETQRFGRLACIFADQPYIMPVTFVFRDGYIYGQTNEGTKLEIIRLNRNVCFEVDRVIATNTWESVVVIGEFEELHGEDAVTARTTFMAHAFPIIEEYPSAETLIRDLAYPENTRRVKQVIYRIRIIQINGYTETR